VLCADGAFFPGRRLLYGLILAALRRAERVHVFGFEAPEEEYRATVPQGLSAGLTFHDGFSDPLGWQKSLHSLTLRDLSVQGVRERVGDAAGPVTVVLDSLSWILARCPLPRVCYLLRELSGQQSERGDARLVVLLHADLHDPSQLPSLRLLADLVISITDVGEKPKATVTYRKRSGKVVTHVEGFMVGDDFSLETISELEREPQDSTTVDPTGNLTFNLRLSESQREHKDAVPLPYTFTDSR
ncbi:Elongator complex protein 5, partial [Pristimantis euphronides]